MSDRTADQRRYANSRKVVPSQHEEDQTVLLPFSFSKVVRIGTEQ